jgi:hypothetical protein
VLLVEVPVKNEQILSQALLKNPFFSSALEELS